MEVFLMYANKKTQKVLYLFPQTFWLTHFPHTMADGIKRNSGPESFQAFVTWTYFN
jgi:hypothetical protein